MSLPREEEVLVVLGRGEDLLGSKAPTLVGKDWDFFMPTEAGRDNFRGALLGGLR